MFILSLIVIWQGGATYTRPANMNSNLPLHLITETLIPGVAQTEASLAAGLVNFALGGPYDSIVAVISLHGYTALFLLMLLEGAAFPIPSEVIIPIAGLFSARGIMNPAIALFAIIVGSSFGMAIDYYIGYYLGREFFYKHIGLFRLSRKNVEDFEKWFARNGVFAVFITRLLPVVRSVVNFPAGFAGMPKTKFFLYSIAGVMIWDGILLTFGYYVIATNSAVLVVSGVAMLDVVFYYLSRKYAPRFGRHGSVSRPTARPRSPAPLARHAAQRQ